MFWASYDYSSHKSIVEIVGKILEAHQYTYNLENLLACIESLWFGQIVQIKPAKKQAPVPVAKGFMPCISFYLPVKSRSGALLKLFYDELKSLQVKEDPQESKAIKAAEAERKKHEEVIAEQKKQIDQLTKQTDWLQGQLSKAQSAQAGTGWQEVDSQFEGIKAGLVHKINPEQRLFTVKAGRQHFRLSMIHLQGVPEEGSPCFITPESPDCPSGVIFPLSRPRPLTWFLSKITGIQPDGLCRISCPGKGLWQFRPENSEEKEILAGCTKNQSLLVGFFHEYLISFIPVETNPDFRSQTIQESIARIQIVKSSATTAEAAPGPSAHSGLAEKDK